MGLTAKKKPRFSLADEGILESKLVQLPTLLVGALADAMMAILQDCGRISWEIRPRQCALA
jgi:hypothetical protein